MTQNFFLSAKKRNSQNIFLTTCAALILASCDNLSNEVEKKLNKLQQKTESLDSLVNEEFEKVTTLDSLILKESEKVKKLDTLLHKSTSQLDSIIHKN